MSRSESTKISRLHDRSYNEYQVFSAASVKKWAKFGLGIELATSDGRSIAIGPAATAPGHDKQLVLVVPPLAPGRYRVSWHVVSVDTHRTEGEYTFTVGP
jgi:methionine-rich copper-binding protein CopC